MLIDYYAGREATAGVEGIRRLVEVGDDVPEVYGSFWGRRSVFVGTQMICSYPHVSYSNYECEAQLAERSAPEKWESELRNLLSYDIPSTREESHYSHSHVTGQ